MLEAAILILLLLIPLQPPWWVFCLAFLLTIPGAYAMWTGAPFVPTGRKIMGRMLALADIQKGECVYDLGCGDGRLVFAAAKRGAQAIGYELSLPTYLIAKFRSIFHKKSEIRLGNFWTADLSDADVIFCFLLQETMQTFREHIWPRLPSGCRVVSHAFTMRGIEALKEDQGVVLYVKD